MTASQALAGWWRRATGRPWKPRIADDGALEGVLRAIAARHRQPAMAAALVQGDAVVAQAAVGVLAHDDRRLVRLDSRFHVGSTTKGMTALVVATLVREGRLRYDDELGGLLPDLPMHDAYRAVTVHDLLVHRVRA